MTDKPRRRWFSFSLRSLLVATTVFGVWLGWETSVVRQRSRVQKELETTREYRFTTAAEYADRYGGGPPPANIATIPLVRRWLGDRAVQEIWYYSAPKPAERERIAKVFPEASIDQIPLEPCHPGCFPRGTLVMAPGGPRLIETIQPGDALTAFHNGHLQTSAVQSVFVTSNRLWNVTTQAGVLVTTKIQPLCLSLDHPLPAGDLKPGDTILYSRDGVIRPTQVISVAPTDRTEQVFNLVLGECEIFIANGFLSRSKPPAEPVAQ
jgi:hypothetical protein